MTITSNQLSFATDTADVDRRPGSSDIAWAEHAYRSQRMEPSNERRRMPGARGRRLRILVVTLAGVLLMAGLVVAMRYEGSSPAFVVQRPTSTQVATAPQQSTARSFLPFTPPLLRPFPSLPPTFNTPNR